MFHKHFIVKLSFGINWKMRCFAHCVYYYNGSLLFNLNIVAHLSSEISHLALDCIVLLLSII